MNKLYFITGFEKIPEGEDLDIGSSRCFGYYEDFVDADFAVINNTYDIFEGLYEYTVIEEYSEGIHYFPEKRWFYEYSYNNRAYHTINEPETLKHLTNFAMG